MTGKSRYLTASGSANLAINGKKFSIQIDERTVTVTGNKENLQRVLPKLHSSAGNLSTVRKVSGILSKLGITLKLDDGKGVILSAGKGIWTPLGHFSFRPRLRKYFKGN